jgi:hypothetical protein
MFLVSISFLGPPGRGEKMPFPTITCQGECVRLQSQRVWNNKKVKNMHRLDAWHGHSPCHSIALLCLWICSISLLSSLTCVFSSPPSFLLQYVSRRQTTEGDGSPPRGYSYIGERASTQVWPTRIVGISWTDLQWVLWVNLNCGHNSLEDVGWKWIDTWGGWN